MAQLGWCVWATPRPLQPFEWASRRRSRPGAILGFKAVISLVLPGYSAPIHCPRVFLCSLSAFLFRSPRFLIPHVASRLISTSCRLRPFGSSCQRPSHPSPQAQPSHNLSAPTPTPGNSLISRFDDRHQLLPEDWRRRPAISASPARRAEGFESVTVVGQYQGRRREPARRTQTKVSCSPDSTPCARNQGAFPPKASNIPSRTSSPVAWQLLWAIAWSF